MPKQNLYFIYLPLLLVSLFGSHLSAQEDDQNYDTDDDYYNPVLNERDVRDVQEVYYINRYSRRRNPEMYNAPGNTQQGTLNNYYQYVKQRDQNNDKLDR